jgi:GxxExxY protein
MHENEIAKIVFESGLKVHRALGPGLLESSYEECLYYELVNMGLAVEKQKPLPVIYENVRLDTGYRVDFWIEEKVIIEIKSIECLMPIHTAQVLTYLKWSSCKLALLINFNVVLFKDGVKRIIRGAL